MHPFMQPNLSETESVKQTLGGYDANYDYRLVHPRNVAYAMSKGWQPTDAQVGVNMVMMRHKDVAQRVPQDPSKAPNLPREHDDAQ
jgi:hypothetical protein